MGNNSNGNKKKLGKGMRYADNGRIECYGVVHNRRGDSLKYSFTRDTKEEAEYIKAKIVLLGVVDNDVIKIRVNRFTDEVELIRKGTSKKRSNGLK